MEPLKNDWSDTEMKKNLPVGTGSNVGLKTEIEPILKGEKLDFKTIRDNPVLRPIADINNSYINLELIINRALYEYEEQKKKIDSMIEANPKYSETIILSVFQNILQHIKQIIHAQDIQKDNMKEAVNQMVKIVKDEYGLLESEENNFTDFKKEIPKHKEGEIEDVPKEEKKIFSTLLDKEIDAPDIKEVNQELNLNNT